MVHSSIFDHHSITPSAALMLLHSNFLLQPNALQLLVLARCDRLMPVGQCNCNAHKHQAALLFGFFSTVIRSLTTMLRCVTTDPQRVEMAAKLDCSCLLTKIKLSLHFWCYGSRNRLVWLPFQHTGGHNTPYCDIHYNKYTPHHS